MRQLELDIQTLSYNNEELLFYSILLYSLGKPGGDFFERGGDVLLVEWQHRPVVDVQLDEVLLREIT